MDVEQNRTLVRRFHDILNRGGLDRYGEILPPAYVDRNPLPGQASGIKGLIEALAGFRAAFPDIRFTIEDILAEGDRVAVRTTGEGTHRGDFMGFRPTAKRVRFAAIDIHRIASGRIAASWHVDEIASVLAQIGALSPPPTRD